jgi:S-phase kinase-associated protein 1
MADEAKLGGLDDAGDESFSLVSKEEERMPAQKKNIIISKLVQCAVETDPATTEIPLHCVDSKTLTLIIDYSNHHAGQEAPNVDKPLRSKNMKDVCKDPWDATFIDEVGKDLQQLYNLILAANYMDIQGLLHLGCAKVASIIKGEPLERIKDLLSVEK